MNRRGFMKRLLAAAAATAVPVGLASSAPLIVPVRFMTKFVDGELVVEVENPEDADVTVPFVVTGTATTWRYYGSNCNNYSPLHVGLLP